MLEVGYLNFIDLRELYYCFTDVYALVLNNETLSFFKLHS